MDTIRAWKDREYRKSFDPGALPQHPAGLTALDDDSLDDAVGGTTGTLCMASIVASIVYSVQVCSDHGSCGYFTNGCC